MQKEIYVKIVMYTIIVLLMCAISFQACERIYEKFGIEHDNYIEQALEDAIEHHSGIEIDLTPSS